VPHFEKVLRLGVFEDPLKHLIHQMKYNRRWAVGEFLADRLLETERAKGLLTETEVLVPVPLHFRRHIARGYNQADVIARRLGRRCSIPVVNAARRIRSTEQQTQLHSHEKRGANVRGAFALSRCAKKLQGKHVVLIDDVTTSGSTLRALGYLLKQTQPATLCAMTLAIADPKRRGFEVI
jgi:ComF family protein